jgi:uncharacterized protein (TIGR02246 family)
MRLQDVQRWIDRYVAAWRTSDADEIRDLFTEDARYFTRPYLEPKRGREEIAGWWLRDPDETGTWECDYRARAVSNGTALVTGWTTYATGEKYHNAFVIGFDDRRRATEFTEWWMLEPRPGDRE